MKPSPSPHAAPFLVKPGKGPSLLLRTLDRVFRNGRPDPIKQTRLMRLYFRRKAPLLTGDAHWACVENYFKSGRKLRYLKRVRRGAERKK